MDRLDYIEIGRQNGRFTSCVVVSKDGARVELPASNFTLGMDGNQYGAATLSFHSGYVRFKDI